VVTYIVSGTQVKEHPADVSLRRVRAVEGSWETVLYILKAGPAGGTAATPDC